MKYRSRTGKALSDQNVLQDLSSAPKGMLQASPANVSNFFAALFQYLISAMAFISRSFLRRNLGERTFGVMTLLAIIFFVMLILAFPSAYQVTNKELFPNTFDNEGWWLKIIVFLFTFVYPFYIGHPCKSLMSFQSE